MLAQRIAAENHGRPWRARHGLGACGVVSSAVVRVRDHFTRARDVRVVELQIHEHRRTPPTMVRRGHAPLQGTARRHCVLGTLVWSALAARPIVLGVIRGRTQAAVVICRHPVKTIN